MLAIGQIFLKLLTKLHIGNQEAMFTAEVMGNFVVLEWKEIKSFIWEKSGNGFQLLRKFLSIKNYLKYVTNLKTSLSNDYF